MIPRINLYQASVRLPQDWLSPGHLGVYCLVMAILLSVASILLRVQQEFHVTEMGTIQERVATLQGEVNRLKGKNQSLAKDSALEQKVKGLEQSVQAKKQVLAFMSGSAMSNREGFSKHLLQLASSPLPDLWLPQIVLENGGGDVTLVGRMFKNDAVFQLVDTIRQNGSFNGYVFPYFQISEVAVNPALGGQEVAPQQFRFVVSTSRQSITAAWDRDLNKWEKTNLALQEVQEFQARKQATQKNIQKAVAKGG